MNEFWNLQPMYTGFDDPAFEGDLAKLKETVAEAESFASALETVEPLEGLRRGIALQETFMELAEKLVVYSMLRQAANSRDGAAGSNLGRVMAALSGFAAPQASFESWAAKLPDLMELVRADESLRDYEFLFANVKDSSRHLLSAQGEEIMAKMSLSGGDAWSDLQGYLTSTVHVSYRGTTTNLSSIRNLAYDADPQVRKDAYEAEIACYDRIKDAVAFALNSIKLETISDCQLRGYESPLLRTLKSPTWKRLRWMPCWRPWTSILPSSGSI